MGSLADIQKLLWALSEAGQCLLLILLISRKAYRDYPWFTVYLLAVVLQNALSYAMAGFLNVSAYNNWRIGWAVQCIVVGLRAFAVAEVCRHFVGRFRGIWALARGILIGCGVVVLLASMVVEKHRWYLAILYADRGLEMAFAAVIVTLFLFARYYQLEAAAAPRWLAIGFFFFSCAKVLNNSVLERWLNQYYVLWNVLETLAFLAVLVLWTWTFRGYRWAIRPEPVLLPANVYRELSPDVNLRLSELNERLSEFWTMERPRS
jgi:hypothetical protein